MEVALRVEVTQDCGATTRAAPAVLAGHVACRYESDAAWLLMGHSSMQELQSVKTT